MRWQHRSREVIWVADHEVRLRAGLFPAVRLVAMSVGIAALAYVTVGMVRLLVTQWGSTTLLTRVVGLALVLGFVAVAAALSRVWVASLNGLRPLRVVPGPDGTVSVPTVAGWRWGRDTVPLVDVRGCTLALNTEPRAMRRQLVVHADQGTWVTDSVTSMNLRPGGLERSRAQRVRDELGGYAVASRG